MKYLAEEQSSIFIYTNHKLETDSKTKLALFDLDDTLIKYPVHTKINRKEWHFLFPNVLSKLKYLYNQGYFIAILSNQLDLHPYLERFKEKLELFLSRFDFPVLFIASLRNDFYRKPLPGMFYYVKKIFSNFLEGFYVGDAAGRRYDHSCCDIKFAYNCQIKFYTPEAFFINGKNIELIPYNIFEYKETPVISEEKSIILLFGRGRNSGKSHFSRTFLKNYMILRNNIFSKKDSFQPQKKVFLNIKKKSEIEYLINLYGKENIGIYFLDYDSNIIHFLKTFSKFINKKSQFDAKQNEIHKIFNSKMSKSEITKWVLNDFGLSVNFFDFYFDNQNYTEYQNFISKFIL